MLLKLVILKIIYIYIYASLISILYRKYVCVLFEVSLIIHTYYTINMQIETSQYSIIH